MAMMAYLRAVRSFSIIHLGELCRWVFLFNAMLSGGLWLKSRYLCAWITGSIMVAIYMPIVTGISCGEAMKVRFGLSCRRSAFIALIVSGMDVRGGKPW